MIALAIKQAGSVDGEIESLGSYDGLLKTYDKPFSPGHHEGGL